MNFRLFSNSTYRKLVINLILHIAKFIGSLLSITFEAISYSSGFDGDNFEKSHDPKEMPIGATMFRHRFKLCFEVFKGNRLSNEIAESRRDATHNRHNGLG